MDKIYKDILKEIKKGKAVLLYVESQDNYDLAARFRIVTKYNCEWDLLFYEYTYHTTFTKSCFVKTPQDAKTIIDNMIKHDKKNYLKIKDWTII